MSFSDKPREPRAPRRVRARLSLKMQAIGFLSRREHSRQELRAKLLDSLRRRAREDAALEAAADEAARELVRALSEQPSNGIDDAFAPLAPEPEPAHASASLAARAAAVARAAGECVPRARVDADARAAGDARDAGGAGAASSFGGAAPRAALETLSLASGAPLPPRLQASLASAITPTAGMPSPPAASGVGSAEAPLDEDVERIDPETAVDQLLDWLAANHYLSETRFVESRVNARSRKQGGLRIKLELSRHGLALEPEQAAALRETEFARAQALWQRKFGAVAPDARLRAKQARFLAARGFAADVVRRVVGGEEEF